MQRPLQLPELRGDIVSAAYLATFGVFFYVSYGEKESAPRILCQWLAWSLLALALIAAYRISPLHPLATYPGPVLCRITALQWAYVVSTGKRHLVTARLHEKYGVFVRIGPNTLSINSHEAIGPIYSSANCMNKSNSYRPGRVFDGGLFFIREKDIHDARRRIWAPAFSPSSLSSASITASRRTGELVNHLAQSDGSTINLSDFLRRWSYDVMGDLTFGKSSRIELMSNGDKNGLIASGQKATISWEILGEVPMIFDVICYLPEMFIRDIHVLRRTTMRLFSSRKQMQVSQADICSHLLQDHDGPSTEKLSDEELEYDALFAIQAGSDTTSSVFTFLVYYVLADQAVHSKLTAELDKKFPRGIEQSEMPTLFQLEYLEAVVREALRLGTPLPGLPRVVPQGGAVICSKFIPAGTIVGVPIYAQHINKENFWPDPLEFRPERWMPGGLGPGSVLNTAGFIPFSSGSFGCLAKNFAFQELRIGAAHLFTSLDIKLSPSFNHQRFKAGIQNMRSTVFQYPLNVTIRRRESHA
ncbi:cytochrome P450 [Mycena polygramma]|nr:cytochrome P450 [Mycena polygramma]